jgi:sigma-B regulation protein RsbU (phosphoserine phosphatase)
MIFFLGDVCGHGVSAAFYTILLKYFCAHAGEVYNEDPRAFLDSLNNALSERIREGFVTGLAGHFSRRHKDGSRTLFLSHAGHRQVLVYRKQQDTFQVTTLPPGIVMGIPGSEASEVFEIELELGDRFYAFTDGIVEASDPNESEFGMDAVIHQLKQTIQLPIQMGLRALYKSVADFTQVPDQQDDITLVGFELT